MLTGELTLRTGSKEKTFEMREGRPLFAGRTVECDLYLPAPAVSRRHAVFMAKGGKCGIKDLDSSNGTFLNGQRLSKPMRLKHGDVIQIANFIIEFKTPQGQSVDKADQTVILPGTVLAPEPIKVPEPAEKAADNGSASDTFEDVDALQAAPASPDTVVRAKPAQDPSYEQPGRQRPSTDATTVDGEDPVDAPESTDEKTPVLPATAGAEPNQPNPAAAQASRDSMRLTPRPPKAPVKRLAEAAPDEVSDGDGDSGFMGDAATAEDAGDTDLALAKAAAEAGLMGEFVPDVPDAPSGESGGDRPVAAPGGVPTYSVEFPPPPEPDPYAVPISEHFRHAIETRLFLYSFLSDLKEERDQLVAENPGMLDAVKSEIDRQNREMEKMPTAEKAEDMIEKRTARREDLKVKIREAKEKGSPMPPRPSKAMRMAEDIAINQWSIIAQSLKEALPAVFHAGYGLTGREPLAEALQEADIDAITVLGGAAYLLALGVLLEEAKYNRAFVRAKLANTQPPADKPTGGNGTGRKLFGLFSKSAASDDDEEATEEGESYDELVATEKQLGQRVAWLSQESAFIEGMLIKEFWALYTKVALHYLPDHENMPLPVRAFLRYGIVGFEKWWLKEDVLRHVLEDCKNDIVHSYQISKNITNVVYADEYLAAVMEMQITPAMDENLEINERNSPNWKADKALRKLINARSQSALLTELADSLGERTDKLEQEAAVMDERIKNLLPGSKNFKGLKNELGQQRQAIRVEISKLSKLRDKIRDETLAGLREVIQETDERFTSGELPKPGRDFLITREVEAVRKIGRLLANLKERFLPLVMRENFHPDTDAVNDRLAIKAEFADFERRDPAVFLENIIPSKKKANRVDLRISPAIVLLPAAGILAFSWGPRQKPEDGRLAVPTCFIRPRLRERQITYLLSDFRWDTAKAAAGMDVMNSDTIVAAFMGVRWDWRKRSREGREKGLIYTEQNDRTNWRRVYEAYMQTAFDGGKKLYNRNYDFYERIIGKYFDMPEGVELLRK